MRALEIGSRHHFLLEVMKLAWAMPKVSSCALVLSLTSFLEGEDGNAKVGNRQVTFNRNKLSGVDWGGGKRSLLIPGFELDAEQSQPEGRILCVFFFFCSCFYLWWPPGSDIKLAKFRSKKIPHRVIHKKAWKGQWTPQITIWFQN